VRLPCYRPMTFTARPIVLIVEDEPIVRMFAITVVEEAGFGR
jgi:hypothetical protein